jgi:hypothetical protein
MEGTKRLLVLSVVALLAIAGPAGAEEPGPSVVGQEELAVKASQGKDRASAELLVLNPGEAVPFTLTLRGPKGMTAAVKRFSPIQLAARDVTPVKVTFSGIDGLSTKVSGALVVSAGGVPAVHSVSISPALDPSANWAEAIAIGSLLAMVALAAAIAVRAWRKKQLESLGKKAPGPKWSFSSWATTMTATGAVLGTVLAAATFPESPQEVDKDTLVGLNLLFGALVVVAPFLFQAMRRPGAQPSDQEGGLWGYNWGLLVSCSITCGAVLGELGTLALLAWELIGGGTWGAIALVGVGMVFVLAVYYFAVTSWHLATTDWEKLAKDAEEKAKEEVAEAGKAMSLGVAGAEGVRREAAPEVLVAPPPLPPAAWSLP